MTSSLDEAREYHRLAEANISRRGGAVSGAQLTTRDWLDIRRLLMHHARTWSFKRMAGDPNARLVEERAARFVELIDGLLQERN